VACPRADELAAFLAASDHEQPVLWDSDLDRLHLAMRTDLPRGAVARAPIVEVSPGVPDAVVHNGERLSLRDLADRLTDDARAIADGVASGRFRELTAIQRTRLVVAVDQRAAWGAVAGVAEIAASAGFDHIAFLFERPAATAPPPRTAIDDELDALPGSFGPTATRASDNDRSGRLLKTLGFRETGRRQAWSHSRRESITQIAYDLIAPAVPPGMRRVPVAP
jgi:biopolymer transport protein ExbD